MGETLGDGEGLVPDVAVLRPAGVRSAAEQAHVDHLLARAEQLRREGRPLDGRAIDIQLAEGGYPEGFRDLGSYFYFQGRTGAAERAWIRVAHVDADSAAELSNLWVDRGDLVKASSYLRLAATLSPEYIPVAPAREAIWKWRRTHDVRMKDELHRLSASWPPTGVAYAECLTRVGLEDEAISTLRSLSATDVYEAHLPLGNMTGERGWWREAEQAYLRGGKAGDGNSWYNLGLLRLAQGRTYDAIQAFWEGLLDGDNRSRRAYRGLTKGRKRIRKKRLASLKSAARSGFGDGPREPSSCSDCRTS